MNLSLYTDRIRKMEAHSHKGQNGKVLLIGGSDLFHAASRWSLDVLSAMVDMVFYSSVPENNELIREAKREFWDGVVVPRGQVEEYLREADVVLIGPGMTRDEETEEITTRLISTYQQKKWVIDAGALQMLSPSLVRGHMILTPHQQELEILLSKTTTPERSVAYEKGNADKQREQATQFSVSHDNVCLLLKGHTDLVIQGERVESVTGGNPGMTKGGTGDVLAGLVAGLYCFTDDPFAASVVGSYVNKKAGDKLFDSVGPFFKTSQLVQEIPAVLRDVLYAK